MVASSEQIGNPGVAPRPKLQVFYVVVPLTLFAVWYAGIRPVSGYSGTVINSSLVCLCLALIAGIAGRWRLQRAICAFTAGAAVFVMQDHLGLSYDARQNAELPTSVSEAIAVIYVSLTIALLSLRRTSPIHAAMIVFMPLQIVLFAVINLYSTVAGIDYLAPPLQVSPFAAVVHIIIGVAVFIQAIMRPSANEQSAKVWPWAALASVLTAVLISRYVLFSSLAAVVTAVSGAMLITATYLGSSAAITRRAMFRLHLTLKRELLSEQKRRDELQAMQADYEELFEEVPTGVLKSRLNGEILGANKRMADMLGFASVDELIATGLRPVFAHPDDRKNDFIAWQASGTREWHGDVEMRKRDGDVIVAHFTGCRVNDRAGKLRYVLYCYTDVTEARQTAQDKEKLERELRLSHKLEAVGRLAAGVAHEINTPMQYIGDNVHFLSSAYDDVRNFARQLTFHLDTLAEKFQDPECTAMIRKLEEEADLEFLDQSVAASFQRTLEGVSSVAEIVRPMKEFAYPNDSGLTATDVNRLISNTLAVTRGMYVSAATVITEFGELTETYCYTGQLSQVLVNLIVNAAQAVEKANQTTGRPMGEIRISTCQVDEMIEIKIVDNGCGMTQSVMERIFDPFFTTKEVGKGTGQGLAIAHSIITEKHGGTIIVESELDAFTAFTICIPLRKATPVNTGSE